VSLLDRYLVRAILGSVALVMSVFLTLGGLFIFIQQQDDIGVGHYTSGDALLFVLFNVPQQFYELLPIGALVGTLLGLGNLARGSELTIMRAAGISVVRIGGSTVLAGLLLVAAAAIVGEYIAPPLQQVAREQKAFEKFANVSFAGGGGAWVRDGNLIINVERQTAESSYGGMTVFELSPQHRLAAIGHAATASGDSTRRWNLQDFALSRFTDDSVTAVHEASRTLDSTISAGFLRLAVADPEDLESRKLIEVIRHLQANGLDTRAHVFALWSRIARTVGIVFACLLAVPFMFGSFRTAGAGARSMIGLLIGIAISLLQRVVDSGTFAFQLNPIVLAWIPTTLLAAVSLALLARTR
jgi:lipopolysaccharide export system permease protein